MHRVAFALLFALTGCSTALTMAARADPPMKTTCAKAAAVFMGDEYTDLQREEAAKELAYRRLVWTVRVLDVQPRANWPFDEERFELLLTAQCSDADGAGRNWTVAAGFNMADLATPASRADLVAVKKGSVIQLEGMFLGPSRKLYQSQDRFSTTYMKGLSVRRLGE